jgi:hypothetical protein
MWPLLSLLIATPHEMKMPAWVNESTVCANGLCEKPKMKYERIADVQPGIQWMDAGGYCGSWASQRAILSLGAWISQQVVRDHTENCGGHDEEILSCNIEEAWTNLKCAAHGLDPVPRICRASLALPRAALPPRSPGARRTVSARAQDRL